MGIFGELRVQLDPWQVDYGTELPLAIAEQPVSDETVALDIEVAPEEWDPMQPSALVVPSQLIFVDGVRRIEARLIIRRKQRLFHGAFGSHAVGAARVADRTASCNEPRVRRVVVIGSGEALDDPVIVSHGLVYEPVTTLDGDPDAPLRTIQEGMRLAEERLGRELADADDTLVVADGPLTFEEATRGAVLGYIKRIFKLYLPTEHLDLLARLKAGERADLYPGCLTKAGLSSSNGLGCGWAGGKTQTSKAEPHRALADMAAQIGWNVTLWLPEMRKGPAVSR